MRRGDTYRLALTGAVAEPDAGSAFWVWLEPSGRCYEEPRQGLRYVLFAPPRLNAQASFVGRRDGCYLFEI